LKKENFEKDKFEKILDGFSKDGTHPDFPVQRTFLGVELTKTERSNLMFDLPALVVYEQNENGEIVHVGIVFALSSRVDGVCIHVMSKYDGKIICHQIEESPSGKQPAYLLVKEHCTMKNVP
jgi:hypothetical protein